MYSSSKPFNGIRFSCTGISGDLRSDIAHKINSMGGTYYNNLMSDVSVLVVGDTNTDKYRFSVQKRYDLIFIEASAIVKLHKRWIEGENITIKTAEDGSEDHSYLGFLPRFKPFQDLRICISRIDAKVFNVTKQRLAELINLNGGVSTDSLTSSINYLVTTDKSGKRFSKSVEWGIPVLHPKWITDSIKREAMLEDRFYNICTISDFNEIGKNSCDIWREFAVFKNEQNENSRKKRGLLAVSNDDADDDGDNEEARQTKKNKSSLNAWDSIIKSFNKPVDKGPSIQLIEKKSTNDIKGKPSMNPLFEGLKFQIYGFDSKREPVLVRIIRSHSGKVEPISEADIISNDRNLDDTDYILIPHDLHNKENLNKIINIKRHVGKLTTIITEWFIERCLYYNKVKSDLWGKPMVFNSHASKCLGTLDETEKIRVSISGFSGAELLHLEKLISSLGRFVIFSDKLNRNSNLLIINTSLIGLNESNSKRLFEKNDNEICTLLKDVECNKSSLQSMKKKLVFCQNNQIPIYSINFLYEFFLECFGANYCSKTSSEFELNNLRWCIYYPKNLGNNDSQLLKFANKVYPSNKKRSLVRVDSTHRKKEWGKLSGKASESSLNHAGEDAKIDGNDKDLTKESDDAVTGTQIVYGKEKHEPTLLKPTKRSRRLNIY